jgi:hypothetical protein
MGNEQVSFVNLERVVGDGIVSHLRLCRMSLFGVTGQLLYGWVEEEYPDWEVTDFDTIEA